MEGVAQKRLSQFPSGCSGDLHWLPPEEFEPEEEGVAIPLGV